jgi:hypothetical protein
MLMCIPAHGQVKHLLGCLGAILAVVVATCLGPPAEAAAKSDKQPNIILIQADDQTLRQFTDEAMPKTQRLLVDQGTEFTNYFASSGQCSPRGRPY